MENVSESYLESALKQLRYYKTLGEKAMAQLTPEQWFTVIGAETNSIAVIVQHLSGNMLSRWTDFLVTDGEKAWRNRDAEFETILRTPEEVTAAWEKGWQCLFKALEPLRPDQLDQIVYIRNEGHTVMEAVNRQLAHYPYHIGQIVFYAKQLKQTPWDTLSIARNRSHDYNAGKFSKEKTLRHFTDAELEKFNDSANQDEQPNP